MMKEKLIKAGYLAALLCFVLSLCSGFANGKYWDSSLTFMGGALLLATSLYKMFSAGKKGEK